MTQLPESPNWSLWIRQVLAISRLEIHKCLSGRHLIGITLLNFAPVVLLLIAHVVPGGHRMAERATPAFLSQTYAVTFAAWMLRVGVFFTSASLSIALFRTEALEKTTHYYLLAPVRREIVVLGKFVAATLTSSMICGAATFAAYFAVFAWLGDGLGRFLIDGPGLGYLAAYLGVTVLGCVGYGAIFALFGQLWRNPIVSALALFGWESILVFLPPFLKLASVLFYLESLLPYRPPVGPLAILADPPPALTSIGGLLGFAALVLALAGWRARRMEIAYSTD